MRPRPIVKNRGFYKPMQKEERGSLGLNPRAFGLLLIVVEVMYFSTWRPWHCYVSLVRHRLRRQGRPRP